MLNDYDDDDMSITEAAVDGGVWFGYICDEKLTIKYKRLR